jgi:type VI secretion system secreted protein VgrG
MNEVSMTKSARALFKGSSMIATAALALFLGAQSLVAQTPLGTAGNFGALAGSTVTNTGNTVINGDVGVSPGTAVTGFPPGVVVGGAIHSNDSVAVQAQNDLTTAYNAIAAMPCGTDLTGQDLGGLTLTPGTYCFASSAQLTGTLTLDAQGNPNAVFNFQIGSSLTTASASTVIMLNGGSTCNVFWQVGSSATLGTGSFVEGNILALTSITLTTGSGVSGRVLARTGAVTLDSNRVVFCGTSIPPFEPPPAAPFLSLWSMLILGGAIAAAALLMLRR